MNEFLEQFLIEARELVEQATSDLLALEQTPQDGERLDSAFRAFHTLKGGAGIVDFVALSRAVHAAEDVLAGVRSGARPISSGVIGDCLACIDQVVVWLDEIQASGDLPSGAEAEADIVVARFHKAAEEPAAGAAPADPSAAATLLQEQLRLLAEPAGDGREGRFRSAAATAENILMASGRSRAVDAVRAALSTSLHDNAADDLVSAIRALMVQAPEVADAVGTTRIEGAVRTIRVDAERIDALANLTGELTIAKNAMAHIAGMAAETANPLAAALRREHARLDRLVASLQRSVLGLRVLPLRTVFQRLPRVVREIAATLGKPTNLVMEGDDTEADKAVVEMLFEPLLHVIRNALDHGIELPAQRAAAAKPAMASIVLRASRQGDRVIVEVEDDGRGIDIARVRTVAAERALVAPEVLAAMSDEDALEMIFAPGFSTASEVTGLSGRGVGMDAVRSAVERIGGRVAIHSLPGHGSTVRFLLPFSVMITRVMTVEAGGQMFGVPIDAIVETVRIPRAQIQGIGTAGAFVLRDRTIPLIGLAAALGREGAEPQPEAIAVVASVGGQLGALEVDRLGDRLDIMLKPVEGLLAGMPGIAGTTVLGDGQVLLVLDIPHLLS
jgi:two-component system chemotaxis sensor kinase CheA